MSHSSGVNGNVNDSDDCSLLTPAFKPDCAPQGILGGQNLNDHQEMKMLSVWCDGHVKSENWPYFKRKPIKPGSSIWTKVCKLLFIFYSFWQILHLTEG